MHGNQVLFDHLLKIIILLLIPPIIDACGQPCPEEYFEAQRCNKDSDRICQACHKCEGAKYEVRPCTRFSDRECIHVAHPLLVKDDKTTPEFIAANRDYRKTQRTGNSLLWLKVESSHNVIIEDMHNTNNLETNFYITDTKQASDFHWLRESGLRVNIGLLNVHLIPEYVDVDHNGDNSFFLRDPNSSENKNRFQKIIDKFCRNPLPDYYTITLEVLRDRTTAAKVVTCDSRDPHLPPCPSDRINGETFLQRTLNEPCEKMGTFPQSVPSDKPNFYATPKKSPILSAIFNQSYAVERPIQFYSQKCKTAISRCSQCLEQSKCQSMELFESKCCMVDCYTLNDCKLAKSTECTTSPVECAMGDAYLFTLQGNFKKTATTTSQCHIRRKKPDILYEIFYQVEVPGTGFITPKIFRTVSANDIDYQSHGFYHADYVTIEHNTGLEILEEFILVGDVDVDNMETNRQQNLSIYPLKQPDNWPNKRPVVHEYNDGIYIASVQFEEPFLYSTTTWGQDNERGINISKLRLNDELYNTNKRQKVRVMTQSSTAGPYRYWLMAENTAPYIRFSVPGNMSLLPLYFNDTQPQLVIDEHLVTSLELSPGDKIWQLQLIGEMTACPGYLLIRVNDRREMEEFFKLDVLILCPNKFNMTFNIPNFGQMKEGTFDMIIEDSVKTYEVFLSHLHLGQEEDVSLQAEEVSSISPQHKAVVLSWKNLAVIGGLTLVVALLFNKFYIYSQVKGIRLEQEATKNLEGGQLAVKPSSCCCRARLLCVALYMTVKITYSVIFTFTAFFFIIQVFVQRNALGASGAGSFIQQIHNQTMTAAKQMDAHWKEEILREAQQITQMQSACSFYITEMLDTLAIQIAQINGNQREMSMFSENRSISVLLSGYIKRFTNRFNVESETYKTKYSLLIKDALEPSFQFYSDFLRQMFMNEWLSFAESSYNETSFEYDRVQVYSALQMLDPKNKYVQFGEYLEIEEVEIVRRWVTQFWQMYDSMHPKSPSLPVVSVSNVSICNQSQSMIHDLIQLDSVQFFAPALPPEPNVGPVYQFQSMKEEYHFILNDTLPSYLSTAEAYRSHDSLHMESIIDVKVVRIIFLVVDVLLLLYRFCSLCSNVSVMCREPRVRILDPVYKPTDTRLNHRRAVRCGLDEAIRETTPLSDRHIYHTTHLQDNGYPMAAPPPPAQPSTGHTNCGLHAQACVKSPLNLVRSDTLPKVLIGCAVLVVAYLVVCLVAQYSQEGQLRDLGLLDVFISGLHTQIQQMNWYLSTQADYYNKVTIDIYSSQATAELRYLQSLVNTFAQEQRYLMDSYVSEACNILSASRSNSSCDNRDLTTLDLPLLPCNFIPVIPIAFSEVSTSHQLDLLLKELQPYLESLHQLSVALLYILCVGFAVILIFHIMEKTVFNHVRITRVARYARGGRLTVIRREEPGTEESDDEETQPRGTNPRPQPGNDARQPRQNHIVQSLDRGVSQSHDLRRPGRGRGYGETKVGYQTNTMPLPLVVRGGQPCANQNPGYRTMGPVHHPARTLNTLGFGSRSSSLDRKETEL